MVSRLNKTQEKVQLKRIFCSFSSGKRREEKIVVSFDAKQEKA